ncbi:DUF4833 domain-containing protein [Pedobacter nyackensis]|uniref:DUF4833 domain-containing protein n=1 Tax=Pedobacter nyackensis TaxID=475255 RepID=UPI002930B3FA|nr:DUF4833 domain-containing protein [Pedobacter nyackensis]
MKSIKPSARLFLFTWFFSSLFFSATVFAQSVETGNPSPIKFPTPKGISNQLFYLQRDPNTNTIICELNLDSDGDINKKDPIKVYWIRYENDGEKEDLSYIQRKFAYGIQAKAIGNDQYELRFVSHKKLPLYLMKSAEDKKYHVYVTVNNKKIQLDRIFLRIEGGSFWIPNVKYVELKGLNTANKSQIIERIKV